MRRSIGKDDMACINCDNDDSRLIYNKKGFNIVKCTRCKLMYQEPIPTLKDITALYSQEYYDGYYGDLDFLSQYRAKKDEYQRLMDRIESHVKRGRLLEIGSGYGLLLKTAQDRDWKVQGIEISEYSAGYCMNNYFCPVDVGTLEMHEHDIPDKYYDAVVMINVLEHTLNPLLTLKVINRILADDGIIYLEVPNFHNPFYHDDIAFDGHLYYFTKRTIRKMVEDVGFEIIELDVSDFFRNEIAGRLKKSQHTTCRVFNQAQHTTGCSFPKHNIFMRSGMAVTSFVSDKLSLGAGIVVIARKKYDFKFDFKCGHHDRNERRIDLNGKDTDKDF